MITPPGRQNRLLLFVEMELISVAFVALLTTALKHLHTLSNFPFIRAFGALTGYSTIVLGVSFAAAVEDIPILLPSCRGLFLLPYAVATGYGAFVLVLPFGELAGKSHHYDLCHIYLITCVALL